MIKKYVKTIKDYFELVDFKNIYLFLFIFFNLSTTIISLFIPISSAKIIDLVTKGLYFNSFRTVFLLGLLYLIYTLFSYGDYYFFALFFKDTYIQIYCKVVNRVYTFGEDFSKKISFSKIVNSTNMDIINIAELPSYLFELLIQIIKLIFIIFIFFKNNILLGIFVLGLHIIYIYYASTCDNKSAYYFTKQKKYAIS